jgi:hypothetical protein
MDKLKNKNTNIFKKKFIVNLGMQMSGQPKLFSITNLFVYSKEEINKNFTLRVKNIINKIR